MNFAPPRGMRDFYPDEMRVRNKIFSAWREAARRFGFQEYDAPVVETEELLTRKAGEEIVQQIYNFEDKSGRRLALRPEMTPSLARMVISRQRQLVYPLKWTAIAQCFRYERMSKGRKREHFQWNMDIIGDENIMAEAEVLGAALTALEIMGLTADDFKVRVGSRALLAEIFAGMGLDQAHFMPVCMVLDKMGKISKEQMTEMLVSEGLNPAEIETVFELMAISSIDDAAARAAEDSKNIEDLRTLFSMLADAGFVDYLQFDISIIRGLSYYTGIVFEAFDTQNQFRAIFGGGRYDSLLSSLGGEKMPCVGLGFGDVVIRELLAARDKLADTESADGFIIGYWSDDERTFATQIAAAIRQQGQRVDLALKAEKAKKLFSRGNKIRAAHAIYIGPDEVAKGVFAVKNMQTRDSVDVTIDQIRKNTITL